MGFVLWGFACGECLGGPYTGKGTGLELGSFPAWLEGDPASAQEGIPSHCCSWGFEGCSQLGLYLRDAPVQGESGELLWIS